MGSSPDAPLPRIQRLSRHLADQIAAGEVIERPASVVKELVENSLDAAATDVAVEIADAGLGLILVRDNGQGIHHDDLALALESHATSKLRRLDDLEHIVSLGFRGEALPSIASVSRFSITSRSRQQEEAWRLEPRSGPAPKPAAHPPGTTVEARDLFYNTPARRKFLKSPKTEFLHISNLVRALSLSRFAVQFRLLHDGKTVFQCAPAGDHPQSRMRAVMGKAFVRHAVAVDAAHRNMRLWGWVAPATHTRGQTDQQFFHVNGRLIRDPSIQHAIRRAYQDSVPQGRHVCHALYLELEPAMVDVNVHPTKREARFREQHEMYDLIHGAIRSALHQRLPGFADAPADTAPASAAASSDSEADAPGAPGARSDVRFGATSLGMPPSAAPPVGTEHPYPSSPAGGSPQVEDFATLLPVSAPRSQDLFERPGMDGVPRLFPLPGSRHALRFERDGMRLIDVWQARERLLYWELRTRQENGAVASRGLPSPLHVEAEKPVVRLLETLGEPLASYGVEAEPAGPKQVALRAFPECLPFADLRGLLADLLDCLLKDGECSADRVCRCLAGHANDILPEPLALEDLEPLDDWLEQHMQAVEQEGDAPWRVLAEREWRSLLGKPRSGGSDA